MEMLGDAHLTLEAADLLPQLRPARVSTRGRHGFGLVNVAKYETRGRVQKGASSQVWPMSPGIGLEKLSIGPRGDVAMLGR